MKLRSLALTLAISAVAPFAGAQVIYNNLGAATSFTPGAGWTIGTASSYEQAQRFTVSQNAYLDFAEVAVWGTITGPGLINIAVMSDSGAGSPGSVLETISLTLNSGTGTKPLEHAEFANTTYLTTGTAYWFAISAPDNATWTAWEYTNMPTGQHAVDSGQIGFTDGWSTPAESQLGGLRIYGGEAASAVPEPGTYGLIAAAALGFVAAARRMRRA